MLDNYRGFLLRLRDTNATQVLIEDYLLDTCQIDNEIHIKLYNARGGTTPNECLQALKQKESTTREA